MQSKALTQRRLGTLLLVGASLRLSAAETYVDLAPRFTQDAFVSQAPATGIPLDNDGRWLQAATLPGGYQDGTPLSTVDGWTRFRYGPLRAEALDALRVKD